jgi:hypothetical protein
MRNSPNYARVKADVVLPINLDFMDSDGIAVHTHTNYTFSEDIVLYVPNDTNGAVFPYDITAEATVLGTEGVGNRNTTTINKFCVRIVTRVRAETDLLIPAYGFAPIEPATVYGSETCREFFAQPLFPNGKARTVCRQE